jgi:hypothetical protein
MQLLSRYAASGHHVQSFVSIQQGYGVCIIVSLFCLWLTRSGNQSSYHTLISKQTILGRDLAHSTTFLTPSSSSRLNTIDAWSFHPFRTQNHKLEMKTYLCLIAVSFPSSNKYQPHYHSDPQPHPPLDTISSHGPNRTRQLRQLPTETMSAVARRPASCRCSINCRNWVWEEPINDTTWCSTPPNDPFICLFPQILDLLCLSLLAQYLTLISLSALIVSGTNKPIVVLQSPDHM